MFVIWLALLLPEIGLGSVYLAKLEVSHMWIIPFFLNYI